MDNFVFERIINLESKLNPNYFQIKNRAEIVVNYLPLGTTIGSVKEMLRRTKMINELMPIVIGKGETEQSFRRDVEEYWSALTIHIPISGKKLDASMVFDITHPVKGEALKELMKSKNISSLDKAVELIMKGSKGNEDIVLNYATPVNAEEYLWWRHCQYNKRVANSLADVDKSPNIEFYMYSDRDKIEHRTKTVKLSNQAISKVNLILSNTENGKSTLRAIVESFDEDSIAVYKVMQEEDVILAAFDLARNKPARFLELSEDNHLGTKHFLYKCLNEGLLKRLPQTTIIVDVNDSGIILGNSINDAVSFVLNESNAKYISELKAKLKAISI